MTREETTRAVLGLKSGEEAREYEPGPVIEVPGGFVKPGERRCRVHGNLLGPDYSIQAPVISLGECNACKWVRRFAEARGKL